MTKVTDKDARCWMFTLGLLKVLQRDLEIDIVMG